MHYSTKTYGHEVGLSACFRQHRAQSHCRFLHGYALSVKLTFRAETLDSCNWVQDFGGLKEIKTWLQETFDHKLLVAGDDPQLASFKDMHLLGLADVLVLPGGTGCEAFAKMIYGYVYGWLEKEYKYGRNAKQTEQKEGQVARRSDFAQRVFIDSVEVREHGANSAIYTGDFGV